MRKVSATKFICLIVHPSEMESRAQKAQVMAIARAIVLKIRVNDRRQGLVTVSDDVVAFCCSDLGEIDVTSILWQLAQFP